jgi:GH25 family lysozyme M1 (1,4-beta-N-acetylmuramidase)
MRFLRWLLPAATLLAGVVAMVPNASATTVEGIDVSHWQGSINWNAVRASGIEFAYIKATEGTTFRDASFNSSYPRAYYAGVVRGAYHFALPNRSGGAAQADFFASHGGAWSADNRTLPGMLDIEYNPYGSTCYGISQTSMVNWIRDFINRYHFRTSRWAVIYTTFDWWNTCTGNYGGFAVNNPLWLARYSINPGPLCRGWTFRTIWQFTDSGRISGISGLVDRDHFNGSRARLLALANNTP